MTPGGWLVVLWDDDMNTGATVAFVLHRVVGLTLEESLELPHRLQSAGAVQVAVLADRREAEIVAARMQVFGLHSGVVPA